MKLFRVVMLIAVVLSGSAFKYVPGKYIVRTKPNPIGIADISGDILSKVQSRVARLDADTTKPLANGRVEKSLRRIDAFVAELSEEALQEMENDPDVLEVEQERLVSISGGLRGSSSSTSTGWNLDRIDAPFPDASFSSNWTGRGTHIYVIDTGTRATHSDFSGRVGNGKDFIDNDDVPDDCQGHGTHCMGTAGGSTFGVARDATLHAVKVLGCDGYGGSSTVLAGMEWVVDEVVTKGLQGVVASMSLGGEYSRMENAMVDVMVNAGIVVVVAAGNNDGLASETSPASAASAITVGATDSSDSRSIWTPGLYASNYGAAVDISAPGTDIISASYLSDTGATTKSGTSMACPLVAGVAAATMEKLSLQNASPATVRAQIMKAAAQGAIMGLTGTYSSTPNVLLQMISD